MRRRTWLGLGAGLMAGGVAAYVLTHPPVEPPSVADLADLVRDTTGTPPLHPGGLPLTEDLLQAAGVERGLRVLHIPCGSGESTLHVALRFGVQTVGVSPDVALARLARERAERFPADVTIVEGDLYDPPFPNEAFDIVYSEYALGRLDAGRALSAWAHLVRPGGRLAVAELYRRPELKPEEQQRLDAYLGAPAHTLDEWRDLFAEAGLVGVSAPDRSDVLVSEGNYLPRDLGLAGLVRLFGAAIRRMGRDLPWLAHSVNRVRRAVRRGSLGYAIIVGAMPEKARPEPSERKAPAAMRK